MKPVGGAGRRVARRWPSCSGGSKGGDPKTMGEGGLARVWKTYSLTTRSFLSMGAGAHPLVRESVEFHRRVLTAELQLTEVRLREFERKHGFSSEEFARQFEAGTLGDAREWFDWMAELETVRTLREKVASLKGLP